MEKEGKEVEELLKNSDILRKRESKQLLAKFNLEESNSGVSSRKSTKSDINLDDDDD